MKVVKCRQVPTHYNDSDRKKVEEQQATRIVNSSEWRKIMIFAMFIVKGYTEPEVAIRLELCGIASKPYGILFSFFFFF